MKEEIRKDGKTIGVINHDVKMYFSHRDPNKHLMLKWDAWGVSEKVLNYLDKNKVTHIVIITDKRTYVYSLLDFMLSKLEHTNEEDDVQLFVERNKAK